MQRPPTTSHGLQPTTGSDDLQLNSAELKPMGNSHETYGENRSIRYHLGSPRESFCTRFVRGTFAAAQDFGK